MIQVVFLEIPMQLRASKQSTEQKTLVPAPAPALALPACPLHLPQKQQESLRCWGKIFAANIFWKLSTKWIRIENFGQTPCTEPPPQPAELYNSLKLNKHTHSLAPSSLSSAWVWSLNSNFVIYVCTANWWHLDYELHTSPEGKCLTGAAPVFIPWFVCLIKYQGLSLCSIISLTIPRRWTNITNCCQLHIHPQCIANTASQSSQQHTMNHFKYQLSWGLNKEIYIN